MTLQRDAVASVPATQPGGFTARNVLIVSVGSHGDVHPFVGLGRALRGRGHRVTVLTNDHFAPLVRQAGLGFGSIGTEDDFERMKSDPDLWHPTRAWRFVFERGVLPMLPLIYAALEERYEPGRTVVVGSSLALGARVFEEVYGVPAATVHLSPLEFNSMEATPRYPGPVHPAMFPRWVRRPAFALAHRFIVDPVVAPGLNAFRAEKGLREPVRGVLLDWWNSPRLVLGMFPDWFAPPQSDWPPQTRLTGFPLYDESDLHERPLSEPLERFLAAGDPPVAFTPGSAMVHGLGFFEASADACRRLGRRGILLTRHAEQVPPPSALPPGVIHVDYAPFSALLPRCAALVHHGGVGTCAQSLAAGVPQLVMPLSHDQPDNADRLKRLGVGDAVSPRRYKGPRVAGLLRNLLESPEVARRCRDVAGRFKGVRPLGGACELLEEVAVRGEARADAIAP